MKEKWYHSSAKTLPKIFYLKCYTRGFYPKTRTKLLVFVKESTHETSDDFFIGRNFISATTR